MVLSRQFNDSLIPFIDVVRPGLGYCRQFGGGEVGMASFPLSGSDSSVTFVGSAAYLANGYTVTLDVNEIANRSTIFTTGSLRLEVGYS